MGEKKIILLFLLFTAVIILVFFGISHLFWSGSSLKKTGCPDLLITSQNLIKKECLGKRVRLKGELSCENSEIRFPDGTNLKILENILDCQKYDKKEVEISGILHQCKKGENCQGLGISKINSIKLAFLSKKQKEFLYALTQEGLKNEKEFILPYFVILKINPRSLKIEERIKKTGYGKKIRKGGNLFILEYQFQKKIMEIIKGIEDENEKRKILESLQPHDFKKVITVYNENLEFISSFPCDFFDFEVKENYLYGLKEEGLEILDFKDPKNPVLVSSLEFEDKVEKILSKNKNLYLLDNREGSTFLYMVDVKDPKHPKLFSFEMGKKDIGLINQKVKKGIWFVSNNSGVSIFTAYPPIEKIAQINLSKNKIKEMETINDYLYCLSEKQKLLIYEIKNIFEPRLKSTTTFEKEIESTFSLAKGGNRVFYGGKGILVININNPLSPQKEGLIETPGRVVSLFLKSEKENQKEVPSSTGSLEISTSKSEYKQGERVQINIKNNFNSPIWYLQRENCENSFLFFEKCNGEKISIPVKCKGKYTLSLLDIGKSLKGEWDQKVLEDKKEKIAEPGCYRAFVKYSFFKEKKLENWEEGLAKAYSNEFKIKENKYLSQRKYCERTEDCLLNCESECVNKYHFSGNHCLLKEDFFCECINNQCMKKRKVEVSLELAKLTYSPEETIVLEIRNVSEGPIWWINDKCSEEPLNVYKYTDGEWEILHFYKETPCPSGYCCGRRLIMLPAGEIFEINYKDWMKHFTPGKYKIGLDYTSLKPENYPYTPNKPLKLEKIKTAYSKEFEITGTMVPPSPSPPPKPR